MVYRYWTPDKIVGGSGLETEGWGIRVAVGNAETTRRRLLGSGVLDPSRRPVREGAEILFPVTVQVPGAEWLMFPKRPDRVELPRHELVGGIALMYEDDPEKARLLLQSRPSLHTVLFPESEVSGPLRTRRFRLLAGRPGTETVVTEHSHRFLVDLAEAYFSARLSTERQRLGSSVAPGECVLDMFAGVGPFAITLSERAAFVVACDINPAAVALLCRNCAVNRVKNVVPVLADAGNLPAFLPAVFDRVVMNLPLDSRRFLPAAFALCRKGGTISWYVLQAGEHGCMDALEGFPVSGVRERFVRSYSPGKHHAVYEITR